MFAKKKEFSSVFTIYIDVLKMNEVFLLSRVQWVLIWGCQISLPVFELNN